jgi:hypothetical protein
MLPAPMRSICPAWPPLINHFEDALGILDCVSDGALPRAAHGLTPISLSFRAARIVAAKRIAYFRCLSIWVLQRKRGELDNAESNRLKANAGLPVSFDLTYSR